MDFIALDKTNLAGEHICCAISASKEARICADAKKQWMNASFFDGYSFIKLKENAKVFIETTPAENAWCPIRANNWLFIDCFWVSGKYAGKGYANALFDLAVQRAQNLECDGLVALSSDKKRPFLSEPGFYMHKGFTVADSAAPFYRLMALPLKANTHCPSFKDSVTTHIPEEGVSLWYTDHCPHTSKYVPLLERVVGEFFIPFHNHKLVSKQQAQGAPNPFTTYSMYYNGQFVTNEIFSEAKMRKFLESEQGNG